MASNSDRMEAEDLDGTPITGPSSPDLTTRLTSLEATVTGFQADMFTLQKMVTALCQASGVTMDPATGEPTAAATTTTVPPAPPVPPAPVPTPKPSEAITALSMRELSRQSLALPEKAKLTGPENYSQWLQAVNIQFTALGYDTFTTTPAAACETLSTAHQALLLMTIRNTLQEGPLSTISNLTSPVEAFTNLKTQYGPSQGQLREQLYKEFHALHFDGSLSIVDYNAHFNTLVQRLGLANVAIQEVDQLNHYFNTLEAQFPSWVERCKAVVRH